jgi:hypothetical protein
MSKSKQPVPPEDASDRDLDDVLNNLIRLRTIDKKRFHAAATLIAHALATVAGEDTGNGQ